LGHILEAASDAVVSVDAEQRILSCNRAGEEMFEYAADDLVGRPLSVLLPERLRAAVFGPPSRKGPSRWRHPMSSPSIWSSERCS
jgi:PAS domain-containing protein